MSRKLLKRVIDEGWKAWSIKSVASHNSDLEDHWCISNELEDEIKKYLAGKGRAKYTTGKGRYQRDNIYDYIVDYIKEHSYAPSVRDIRYDCNISSTSVVNYYLEKLVEEGRIEREPYIARGIRVL